MCELTSVPYSRMDLHRDFISDPQCDYYEKDPNCATNAPGTRPSWWNQQSRPSQPYGPPYSTDERLDTRYDNTFFLNISMFFILHENLFKQF